MAPLAIVSVGITILLAMFAAWALLVPYFQGRAEEATQEGAAGANRDARTESLLQQLDDLESEFRDGRISSADHLRLQGELTGELERIHSGVRENR